MSWTPEKVEKLKELWGKGSTASEIAPQYSRAGARSTFFGPWAHQTDAATKC